MKLDLQLSLTESKSSSTCMETLTEYFGFSPTEFVDDIINTVNDSLYKAMDELEKLVQTQIKDQEQVEKVSWKEFKNVLGNGGRRNALRKRD